MMKRAAILLFVCLSSGWLFANHWTPNDSGYEDNMTLTAVIQINGIEQQLATLEVGAFCGEECRGSGYPTYFLPTQRYIIQLLIYGESNEPLTFKLHNSVSGQELNLYSPAMTFNTNGYGSLSAPYILNFTRSGPEDYAISVSVNPDEGGTVEGAGEYQEGQTCTLVATPNEGYVFSNWTEDDTEVSANSTYAFSVTFDRDLVANFVVMGNSTHWTPNESAYEDNMTLTAVIQIDGIEQQLTTLEVGAFCGEECRGSGYPTYFLPAQRYVIQLLIYGESNDPLTFKLYDSDSGQELDLASTTVMTFNTNGYGSLSDPYVLNFTRSVHESYAISVSVNPEEGGTVEGAGEYQEGQTCTLVATPHEGYVFSNWMEDGTVVSTRSRYAFSVTSNRTLIANFVVIGSTHWTPNELAYEDNMTLTGVVQINGVEQQSASLEVGVFCGEECRGAGLVTYFIPTQRYVVQLLIFGEESDQLTFKLYDHAVGQELHLIPPESVTFEADGYGSLNDPYVLVFWGEEPSVAHFIITGNWSEASNWESGMLPRVFDEVFIDAPCQLDQNATVAKLTVSDGQSLTLQSGQTLIVTNVLNNEAATGLVIEDGAQLMHASENVSATVKKNIEGHGVSQGKYRLISNPLTSVVDPEMSNVYHLVTGNYDLYDWLASAPDALEWRNFKDNTFLISPEGYGYLYANQDGVELTFPGILRPSKYRFGKTVTYDSNDTYRPGWNLIGNPFVCDAYLVDEDNEHLPFYRMNAAGNDFEAATFGAIAPMEGVFYRAPENGTVYFVITDSTLLLTICTINVISNPTEGGTLAGGGTYIEGQTCTVMATPNANFTFANWMENGEVVSTDVTYTFVVNADRTLVASFTYVPPTYTISVSASPTNGGTVSGGSTYTEGQTCTVMATPNANYTFTGWMENGSVVSTDATYTFVVNADRNLVASFTYVPPTYTISVSANPTNGGTVSGGGTYTEGQTCTVMATPNANYTFTNWMENGSVVSTNVTYTFVVNADRNLVASFSRNIPAGAINGQFTINTNGDQVYFSQGNLQYQASTNTWRFATNQYEYVGSDNSNISQTYSGWIDLFGWGTSGYNHGANSYQPWSTSQTYRDYYAYGNYRYNLYEQTGQADWGYNPISNGGNNTDQWRTLTREEWTYLLNTRSTTSGERYAKAEVAGICGVILLPDDWNTSYYTLNSTNSSSSSFESNIISSAQWSSLEQHGAVFLPTAGSRSGTSVLYGGDRGYYWSSSCNGGFFSSSSAYFVYFDGSSLSMNDGNRSGGYAVRLVRIVQ